MRESITIQGLDFAVHSPYEAGHVLSADEAGVLNQTFHENLRNNFASTVKDAKAEHGDELPETALTALQTEFDEYAKDYKFGVRRAGSRGPSDPVEAEAFKMAKDSIRAKLKELGRKADASDIADAATRLLATDKGEAYRSAAKRRVQEAQKIASESLEDVLQNLSAPEEKAAG